MTCFGYAKKSDGCSCQRCWAKEDGACHKMLQSVTGTLLPCAKLWGRQKEASALQGADGSVLYSSGQSWKTLMYTLITMGFDWSTQSHTA